MDTQKRQPDDEHPIFRSSRNPISLPSETIGRPSRGTSISIAVFLLIASLIAGVLHEFLWEEASSDATRLLPGTSRTYLEAERPAEQLSQLSKLDRWSSPDLMATHLSQENRSNLVFGKNTPGLPYGSLFETLLRADSIFMARVPTPESTSTVVMAKIVDNSLHKQLWRSLQPHLEVRERHLGYDILTLTRTRLSLPWSDPILPMYFVDLKPFIVGSYGSIEAMHQVLHAKVGTTTQPVRSRPGFRLMRSFVGKGNDLRGFITPGESFDWLLGIIPNRPNTSSTWRSVWVSEVSSISWSSYLSNNDDVAEVHIHLPEPVQTDLLEKGKHELIRTLPNSSIVSASFALADLPKALEQLRGLLSHLHRKAARPTSLIGLAHQLRALRSALFRSDSRNKLAMESEVVLSLLDATADETKWVVLVKIQPAAQAEALLEEGLSRFFGETYSTGSRQGPNGRIHMIRPAGLTQNDSEYHEMVWRLRGNRVEFAPHMNVFTMLDEARWSGRTYDNADVFSQATRSLHQAPSFIALLNPFRGPWATSPWVRLITERLNANFRLAITAQLGSSDINFRSNVGLWTPLAALLTAGYSDLNTLGLQSLSEPCRTAFTEMCAALPDSRPCRVTNPERTSMARETCRRLGIVND